MSQREQMFNRICRLKQRQEAAKAGIGMHLALAGSMALASDLSPVSCPFALDTPAQRTWLGGWLMAYDRRFP